MPNLWREFQALLPQSPLLIGTVIVNHGDGTRSVSLLDGGVIRVKGDAAINERVFVRGDRIEGSAPDLPQYTIEI